MAERVRVEPELLRWARNRVHLGVADLARERKFKRYAEWEAGEQMPTMRQLEYFARKTRTPLGYLFLSKPPVEELPIPDFRTLRDQRIAAASPDLLETIHTMQRRQAWAREYLIELGVDPLTFVRSATIQDHVDSVAAAMRVELGLAPDWAQAQQTWEEALRNLIGCIENSGVMVMANGVVGINTHRPLDVEEFRGFVLCDEYAPLVFLNNADSRSAQMFTLVHELAHLWVGQDGLINLDRTMPGTNAIERFCNQIAAEFLVPAELFTRVWLDVHTRPSRFDDLARHFKVSPIVTARRALDLRRISREDFFGFYDEYQEGEWKKQKNKKNGGGDFHKTTHRRLGDRFTRLMYQAVRSGRLSYTEAYRLTDLRGRTFEAYMGQFGESR